MAMDLLGIDLEPALRQLFGRVPDAARLEALRGDASSRRYFRMRVDEPLPEGQPRELMIMQLPEDALGSDEKAGPAPDELPFLDVQRLLQGRGLPVPRVYVEDVPHRVLVLEDLGDETFHLRLQRLAPEDWPAAYAEAVRLLARMHTVCAQGRPEESVAFRRRFDGELLRWELDHFREWGLGALGVTLSYPQRSLLDRSFDDLTRALLRIPTGFVHRDYQSKNLMWAAPERLVLIDFQDALIGPRPYDLVALLCDSYVALDAELQDALIEQYMDARGLLDADRPRFRDEFWQVAAQRKLKDAGRFVFIDQVRGNPDFLKWFPQTMRYVDRALSHLPDLSPVRTLLAERIAGYPDAVAIPPVRTGFARDRM